MLYQQLQLLNPIAFRRACGVKRETFLAMVKVLSPNLERHGKCGGQNRLSVADQLLMVLYYWRHYKYAVRHWTGVWGIRSNGVSHN